MAFVILWIPSRWMHGLTCDSGCDGYMRCMTDISDAGWVVDLMHVSDMMY